jgi:outer membrane protein TolC
MNNVIFNHLNNKIWLGGLLLSGLSFFAGCSVGPDYKPPEMEMPQKWTYSSTNAFSTVSDVNNAGWWKIFDDDDLDYLIQRAVENNRDVKSAFYAVEA